MVLEDLSECNYKLGDRVKGLDEDHIKVVLEKIARFHASSMVILKDKPELKEPLNASFFEREGDSIEVLGDALFGNIPHIGNMFKNKIGYGKIAEKLNKVVENFIEKMIRVCHNTVNNKVKVINHGDLWINNFLFRHDDNGKPTDVSLIDLQLAFYGGLGIDLNYFFSTSIPLELLATKRYDFLRFYYKHLKETLEHLKHDNIPTWEEVREEVRSKEMYGFWAIESVLPVISLNKDSSKANTLENFTDADALNKQRKIMLTEKRFYETIKYSLMRFDELGVLD